MVNNRAPWIRFFKFFIHKKVTLGSCEAKMNAVRPATADIIYLGQHDTTVKVNTDHGDGFGSSLPRTIPPVGRSRPTKPAVPSEAPGG